MPHVAFVPLSGLRVGNSEVLNYGLSFPGLANRAEVLSELPSLGLLTLAGMTPEPWSCSYHPSSATSSLVSDIVETRPNLIAISALTASIHHAYELCHELKKCNISTVIGGLHATAMPDEVLQYANAVCVGDGESSWSDILSASLNNSLSGKYCRKQPFDLRESPLPRFDLAKLGRVPRWTVQTQRGCPWACDFCGASRLLGPVRFKPPQKIEQELTAIQGLDPSPWIELADDNTLAGRSDEYEMLEVIANRGVRFFTESDWRIGEQPKLVQALASAGCMQVLVGIESLEFQYPGMGAKSAQLARIMRAIEVIQDSGIVVNGCFIIGADGETLQSMDRLIEFISESSLAEIQITLQTPFPGTGLYTRLGKQGRLLNRDWSHYNLFEVVYQPDLLSVQQLERGLMHVISNVFCTDQFERRQALRREIWRRHPNRKRTTR